MNDKYPKLAWVLNVLRDFFTKNILLKVLSVIFAVAIWSVMISMSNPLRKMRLTDISVSPQNYSSLTSRNFAVTEGETSLFFLTDVVVEVPQNELSSVSASNVRAYVDLNDVTNAGEQTLEIKGSIAGKSAAFKFTPPTITVQVEELSQKLVPVVVNETGILPDGYRIGDKIISPDRVSVKGPKSVVESISRVAVDFPVDSLTASVNDSFNYYLVDEQGRDVAFDALSMTDYSVIIMAPVEPKEEKPISVLECLVGELPEGYILKSVEAQPKTLQVSAPLDSLSALAAVQLSAIDLEGRKESFTVMADVIQPNDITWMQANQVSVRVEIIEVEETREFSDIPIIITNFDGKSIIFDDQKTVRVEITAPRSVIRRLSRDEIEVYADLSAYGDGDFDVPLEVRLRSGQSFSSITKTPDSLFIQIAPLSAAIGQSAGTP